MFKNAIFFAIGKTQAAGIKPGGFFCIPGAILSIAHQGETPAGKLHPDLVGAAGLQPAAHMGIAPIAGNDLPMGHRMAAVTLGYTHLFPVARMASNGRIHSADGWRL